MRRVGADESDALKRSDHRPAISGQEPFAEVGTLEPASHLAEQALAGDHLDLAVLNGIHQHRGRRARASHRG